MTKSTEDWAKELGFEDLSIGVDGPTHITMEPSGDDVPSEYIRPYTFGLWGTHTELDDDGCGAERGQWDKGWESLGHISTYHFMAELAMNDRVDIWDEADAQDGDLESAASVMYGNSMAGASGISEEYLNCDMMLIQHIWLNPAYRGRGVARHLFNRALSFHNPSKLGAVLTSPCSDFYFHRGGREDDPLAGACRVKGLQKLQKMLVTWGFEPAPEFSDTYCLVLDETAQVI